MGKFTKFLNESNAIYGIIAKRTGYSMMGPATTWSKKDNKIFKGTKEEAEKQAKEWNKGAGYSVGYFVEELPNELKEDLEEYSHILAN